MVILRSSKAGTSPGVNNRDRVAPGVFIVVEVYMFNEGLRDSEMVVAQRYKILVHCLQSLHCLNCFQFTQHLVGVAAVKRPCHLIKQTGKKENKTSMCPLNDIILR